MQLPETLGEIDQLFCDKTGTLTQNELSFRSISLKGLRFEGMTKEEIQNKFNEYKGDNKAEVVRNMELMILCFCLCNDMIIIKDENGKDVFNGESQEEHILLDFAMTSGFYELKARGNDMITLLNKKNG